MGFLDSLFKTNQNRSEIIIGAPVKGRCVSIKEVKDPTFADEVLGKGAAVIPEEGKIYAPAAGEISTVFSTGHAVAMTTAEGVELLIHIGLDTVTMNGEGFRTMVTEGKKVKKGELLIEVDLDKVKARGLDTITPVVICNSDDFASVQAESGREVKPGDSIITLMK